MLDEDDWIPALTDSKRRSKERPRRGRGNCQKSLDGGERRATNGSETSAFGCNECEETGAARTNHKGERDLL